MNLTNAIPVSQPELPTAEQLAKEEERLFIYETVLKNGGILKKIIPGSGIASCCGVRTQYGSFDKFMNYHFSRDDIKEIPEGKEGIIIPDLDGTVTIDWVNV